MKRRNPAGQRLYVAEPPSAYRIRKPLTIDCSLLASALFMEPASEDAQATLRDRDLHAPTLIGYELANVALKKGLRGDDAAELRTPLATFDRRLGEAAMRHLSSLT